MITGEFYYDDETKVMSIKNINSVEPFKIVFNEDDPLQFSSIESKPTELPDVVYNGDFATVLGLFLTGNQDEAISLFSSRVASGIISRINE